MHTWGEESEAHTPDIRWSQTVLGIRQREHQLFQFFNKISLVTEAGLEPRVLLLWPPNPSEGGGPLDFKPLIKVEPY